MEKFTKVQVQRVCNYGTQFNQNHYSLYIKLLTDDSTLSLAAGEHLWVNVWLSKADTALNRQLTNAGNRQWTKANGTLIITKNKQFYNGKQFTFDGPVYLPQN